MEPKTATDRPTCPRCGSHRVSQDTTQDRPWTRYFTCTNCGHQWDTQPDPKEEK